MLRTDSLLIIVSEALVELTMWMRGVFLACTEIVMEGFHVLYLRLK